MDSCLNEEVVINAYADMEYLNQCKLNLEKERLLSRRDLYLDRLIDQIKEIKEQDFHMGDPPLNSKQHGELVRELEKNDKKT